MVSPHQRRKNTKITAALDIEVICRAWQERTWRTSAPYAMRRILSYLITLGFMIGMSFLLMYYAIQFDLDNRQREDADDALFPAFTSLSIAARWLLLSLFTAILESLVQQPLQIGLKVFIWYVPCYRICYPRKVQVVTMEEAQSNYEEDLEVYRVYAEHNFLNRRFDTALPRRPAKWLFSSSSAAPVGGAVVPHEEQRIRLHEDGIDTSIDTLEVVRVVFHDQFSSLFNKTLAGGAILVGIPHASFWFVCYSYLGC
jgi:hypothetical protein